MIEIQCSSCHTRYRIDERVLPEDTPTFKCSRCGHVFSAEPRRRQPSPAAKSSSGSDPAPAAEVKPPAPGQSEPIVTIVQSPAAAAEQPPEPSPAEPEARPPKSAAMRSKAAQPPPVAPADDPLQQSFDEEDPDNAAAAESGQSGRNLSFDFREDESKAEPLPEIRQTEEEADNWQVGDESPEFESAAPRQTGTEPSERPRIPPAFAPAPRAGGGSSTEGSTVPDEISYFADRGKLHSAGFFIGLFFLFVLAFSALSALIAGAPMASAQLLNQMPGLSGRLTPAVLPAQLIALSDVKASYQTIKGDLSALVITGKAENVSSTPMHLIEIEAGLLNRTKQRLADTTIYCGNTLAPRMISEMTPRELEFFQKLEPPRNFVLKPSVPTPFTIVFIRPPAAVASFALRIGKAEPVAKVAQD